MFIDTHAHLNFREFEDKIPEVIKRAQEAGVGAIINVGSNFATSKKTIEIADLFSSSAPACRRGREHENSTKLYSAIGIHPIHLAKDITESATFDGRTYSFTTKKEDFDYQKFKKLAESSKKVVAIGETGLDYFRIENNPTKNLKLKTKNHNSKLKTEEIKRIQKEVFKAHIKLAQELDLSLILHCRGEENDPYGAYDEMLRHLTTYNLQHTTFAKGVIHCYGGNLQQAKEFVKLGFYIGFTGIVTFKNAISLQNTLKDCPLEKILIETDCPFLAPEPYRGKRNEPAYVVEVAKKIAEIKNIPLAEVEEQTTKNATKLFNL